MKLLREYIRTLLETGELGQHVWPTADPKLKDIEPAEEDTEIEKRIYQALHKHFTHSSHRVVREIPIDPTSLEAIKRILASGEYTDTFRRCTSGKVMRGAGVPLSWLEKNAPEALEAWPDQRPEEWGTTRPWNDPIPVSFTFEPSGRYGEVSSWTTSQQMAEWFARDKQYKRVITCVLHAECSSGLFLDTRPLDRFKGGVYHLDMGIKQLSPHGAVLGKKGEKERILFGGCQVTHIQLFGAKETYRKQGWKIK